MAMLSWRTSIPTSRGACARAGGRAATPSFVAVARSDRTASTSAPASFQQASTRVGRSADLLRVAASSTGVSAAARQEAEVAPGVFEGFWFWRGHRIRYQRSGDQGEAVVLVHGFGGNADHWRKNTPVLGSSGQRAFAIDLLGYGYSDKPDPRAVPHNTIYCFPVWGEQLVDFINEVVGSPATLSCNSVGGLAGLEAAIRAPEVVRGVQLLNISLRGLHVKRQSPVMRPLVAAFQRLLRETDLGRAFFGSIARPQTVRSVLREAYGVKDAVTDELIDKILSPGLQPGAVDVFLDFISYSSGPLPEELLAQCTVPVSMLWGEADPWESITLGRELLSQHACVTEFVPLPGIGHCPMDEAPDTVNPLIARFVAACSSPKP
ncbi:hypothetical protein FOA52_008155 [Chlamydomonas sp. UWO 241]|nr:hypothetical protein FOA52_008155 [Chlamydomonas sp. UWO 241]